MKAIPVFPAVLILFLTFISISPHAESTVIDLAGPSPDLVITAPTGYSTAAYRFEALRTGTDGLSEVGLNDGRGIVVLATADRGFLLFGPVVDTGGGVVHLECTVWTSAPDVAVALAALDAPEGGTLEQLSGSLATNQPANGASFMGGWHVLEVFYDPEGDAIVPAFQAIPLSNKIVKVYIDNIRITPLRDLESDELADRLKILSPICPPTPIPTRIPEEPSGGWASQSHNLVGMEGESRILLMDLDGDEDQDVLISNSAQRDADPSFQIMKQIAPGRFASPEPLMRRDWLPGLHNDVVPIPKLDEFLLDIMIVGAERHQYAPLLRTFNASDMRYTSSSWRSLSQDEVFPYHWETGPSWQDPDRVRARTCPFAMRSVGIRNRYPEAHCILSTAVNSDEQYRDRLVSTLFELTIDYKGNLKEITGIPLNTGDLDKTVDYVVTSLALTDDGRKFALAESLPIVDAKTGTYGEPRTTLMEWVDTGLFIHSSWPTPHGGHLLAIDLDGSTVDAEGVLRPVHAPEELVVRQGKTVRVFRTDSTVLREIWSGYLPAPIQPGGFLMGHTKEKAFLEASPDDPFSMTFQGKLIAGQLTEDDNIDLLSYADGLRFLPGNGDGTFQPYVTIDPDFPATDACIGDLDGDGDSDILATSGNELRFYFYEGDTPVPGREPVVLPRVPGGEVTTLAGEYVDLDTGTTPTRGTEFLQARRLAVGPDGLFVSDTEADLIKFQPEAGTWETLKDASGNPLDLSSPAGLLLDGRRLLICDSGHHRILSYDLDTKEVSLIAGTGEEGYVGDGGPALFAKFAYPCDVALMPDGRLVIADTGNNKLRVMDLFSGVIENLIPAESGIELIEPVTVKSDDAGNLYVVESRRCRVQRLSIGENGWISALVAGGGCGMEPVSRPEGSALTFPEGLALLSDGSLLIADTGNQRILRSADGVNRWLAGSAVIGFDFDGLPLKVFDLTAPSDIAALSDTEFLVADGRSIRRLRLGEANPDLPDLPRVDLLPTATPTPVRPPTPTPTPFPTDAPRVLGPIGWSENGHFYAIVQLWMKWVAAQEQAASYFDGTGYLATVTSAAENNFLLNTFGWSRIQNKMLGGFQDPELSETDPANCDKGWAWVTGEPWDYTNWLSGEPNDLPVGADYLLYFIGAAPEGAWKDARDLGYEFIVEWDHDPRLGPTPTPSQTPTPAGNG
ncbi:MAG: hypothetical protein ABIH23_25305 [bacterium]